MIGCPYCLTILQVCWQERWPAYCTFFCYVYIWREEFQWKGIQLKHQKISHNISGFIEYTFELQQQQIAGWSLNGGLSCSIFLGTSSLFQYDLFDFPLNFSILYPGWFQSMVKDPLYACPHDAKVISQYYLDIQNLSKIRLLPKFDVLQRRSILHSSVIGSSPLSWNFYA